MVFRLLQKGKKKKKSKVVDTIPTGMYRTGMYTNIEMPMFPTGLNQAVPAMYQLYWPILGNTCQYQAYRPVKKKKLFFFLIFSFVIFKFL